MLIKMFPGYFIFTGLELLYHRANKILAGDGWKYEDEEGIKLICSLSQLILDSPIEILKWLHIFSICGKIGTEESLGTMILKLLKVSNL